MDDEITRDVKYGAGPDGTDVRLYFRGDNELPSVTTILKTLDDDKSALYGWQSDNDGEGDNAYHEYLYWYSRNVGTLSHWFALSELDSNLDWGVDEGKSLAALHNVHRIESGDPVNVVDPRSDRSLVLNGKVHGEVHGATPREVAYSVCKDHHSVESWGEFYDKYTPHGTHGYYTDGLVELARGDVSFFKEAQQHLWRKLHIDEIIAVEEFLFEDDVGYAGQVDLVYADENGHTIVADLKSSSGCYDSHQIQSAAYAKAVEKADHLPDTVDRIEVHRANPKRGEMAVHAPQGSPTLPIHTTDYWTDSYDECWEAFRKLASDYEYE